MFKILCKAQMATEWSDEYSDDLKYISEAFTVTRPQLSNRRFCCNAFCSAAPTYFYYLCILNYTFKLSLLHGQNL